MTVPPLDANVLGASTWNKRYLTWSFKQNVPTYFTHIIDPATGWQGYDYTHKVSGNTFSSEQFSAVATSAIQPNVGNILDWFSDCSSLSFIEGSGETDIEIRMVDDLTMNGTALDGLAYLPSGGPAMGDVFLSSGIRRNFVDQVTAHEIGHALGLEHPSGTPSGRKDDNVRYTIMSYATGILSDYKLESLMLYDVAALQIKYGATGARGDDSIYSKGTAWTTDSSLYCIWDAGGTDTVSAAAETTKSKIDLRQGKFSSIGHLANGKEAENNISIAFNAEIENGIGSAQQDTLIGNAGVNVLTAGDGDDTMFGDTFEKEDQWWGGRSISASQAAGNDTLIGGAGNDTLYGGGGDDVLFGGSQDAKVLFDAGDGKDVVSYAYSSTVAVTLAEDGKSLTAVEDSGVDTLYSIEHVTGNGSDSTFLSTKAIGLELENFTTGDYSQNKDGMRVTADSGNTLFVAGSGILAGPKKDSYVASGSTLGVRTLLGGTGTDALDLSGLGQSAAVSLSDQKLEGGSGFSLAVRSFEEIIGTRFGDVLSGAATDDVLQGNAGDDTLWGGAGNDTLYGGLKDGPDTGKKDTATYVLADAAIKATLGAGPWKIEDGQGGVDSLIGIEAVTGSMFEDLFTVHATLGAGEYTFDGGVGWDRLDYSDLKQAITISGRQDSFLVAAGGHKDSVLKVEHLKATAYDDKIEISSGGPGGFVIDAGNGNNTIKSTVRGATVIAGTGNDVIDVTGTGSIITTGTGNDIIAFADNILITDADAADRIYFGGMRLTGAVKNANSESAWAVHSSGIRYGKNLYGELVIKDMTGRQTFVANYKESLLGGGSTAGILVGVADLKAYRLLDPNKPAVDYVQSQIDWGRFRAKANYGVDLNGADPLVLDLDGDGVELTAQTSVAPLFDADGDGFAERTGWVGSDDAVLALDADGDGAIGSVRELFGGIGGQSGFAELAGLDTDGNGRIDAGDAQWEALKAWRDLDGDAQVDAGELLGMDEAGIASIGLQSTARQTNVNGNTITAAGSYTRTDGSTATVADVTFQIDNFRTQYLGDTSVSAEAAALPELKGYGTLCDLRVAMTQDAALRDVVAQHLPALSRPDLPFLREAALPILSAWARSVKLPDASGELATVDPATRAGVPIAVNADGHVVDFAYRAADGGWKLASGRAVLDGNGVAIASPTLEQATAHPSGSGAWTTLSGEAIGVLERYMGVVLPLDRAPTNPASALADLGPMIDGFWTTLNLISVRLAVQGPLAAYFPGLSYDGATDKFHPATDRQLIPSFEAIFRAAPASAEGATQWLKQWEPVLDVVLGDLDRGGSHLKVSYGYLFQNIVAAYESTGLAIDVKAAAGALGLPQDLIVMPGESGSADADVFYMTAGDQVVNGGVGPDTYVFGRNFGHDTIADVETYGQARDADMIRFADIKSSEVSAFRDGEDLILKVDATGDQVRVSRQFLGPKPALFGGDTNDDTGVAEIVFADGVVWDAVDIAQAVVHVSAASETLTGTTDLDVLDGGAGDDVLSGGDSGDIYHFDLGYGQDVIRERQTNLLVTAPDMVKFGPGITRDMVHFEKVPGTEHLRISIQGTDDTLTIENQFSVTYTMVLGEPMFDQVELFVFDDGSDISAADVMDIIRTQSSTDGNDLIEGFDVSDTLDGGAGNDTLSGGNGDDVYHFGLGYGSDVIQEKQDNMLSGGMDTLIFGAGVDFASVHLSRDGGSEDLKITLADGSELTIEKQFNVVDTPLGKLWFHRVEYFQFEDGTRFNAEQAMDMLIAQSSTDGNDVIHGFGRRDTIAPGKGDDLVYGGSYADTYVYNRGDGHDVFSEHTSGIIWDDDDDRVVFGEGIRPEDVRVTSNLANDIILTIDGGSGSVTLADPFWTPSGPPLYSVDWVEFSDGTRWDGTYLRAEALRNDATAGDDVIKGFFWNDTLAGGAGNDTLMGQEGDDTYLFNLGDGNDVIQENVGSGAGRYDGDRIRFGAGIAPDAIRMKRVGYDLVITIDGHPDTLTVREHFKVYRSIEFMEFADGTVWDPAAVDTVYLSQAATDGDDSISGSNLSEVMYGKGGNDWLGGNGGDDTLIGGTGNDTLSGGDGADVYVFNRGDGQDVVTDTYSNKADLVRLGPGITAADLTLARRGNGGLFVNISGTTDSLLVNGFFNRGTFVGLQLNDGSILTVDQIQTQLGKPTDGNDTLYGGDVDDVISAWGGDDLVLADAGNDSVYAGNGNDTVYGGDGNDLLDGDYGDDLLFEEAGDGVLYGRGGADTLSGGLGNDTLAGGDGNDTYLYDLGDGVDLINEHSLGTSVDTLRLGEGITSERVAFRREANDMVVMVDGRDAVRLSYQLQSGDNQVETLRFADGTTKSLTGNYTFTGSAGNDSINGTNGQDTLIGGLGNDSLTGGNGNDTYVYNRGDGLDRIDENNSSIDTLQLGAGITSSDLAFRREGNDLVMMVDGQDAVRLGNQFAHANYQIETLRFADGTTRSLSSSLSLTGTAGADILGATNGDDTLIGGLGNDSLVGYAGNDTYVYNLGDGFDRVDDGYGGNDVLQLGAGISAAQIGLRRSGSYDLIMTVDGQDAVNLAYQFYNAANQVETLRFADGTTKSLTSSLALSGTAAADVIYATSGDDTLIGGLGNDSLLGGAGNDTYVYNLGDGFDRVDEYGNGGADVLQLGAGITASQIGMRRSGNYDLILTVDGQDAVNLVYQLYGASNQIETLRFADGSTRSLTASYTFTGWTGNDSLIGTSGDDTLIGGRGNDSLLGGAGNDTYVYNLGDGFDRVDEYNNGGTDVVQLGAGITASQVGMHRSGNYDVIITIDGKDAINLVYQLWAPGNELETLRFADGSTMKLNGPYTFTGWTGTDILTGTGGNDTLVGGGGGDTLDGGAGVDTASYGTSSAGVNASLVSGVMGIGGDAQGDKLANIENLEGSRLADTLTGNSGDNTLIGGAGSDSLDGGAGTDTAAYLGRAADYVIARNGAAFTVTDQATGDTDRLTNIEVMRFSDRTITLTAANSAPLARDDTAHGFRGQAIVLQPASLLANDWDLDGNTLSVAALADATGGTVQWVNGQIVFAPTEGFFGQASFRYQVSDGFGGTDWATVRIDIAQAAPPVLAGPLADATHEDAGLFSTDLLAGATDPDASGALSAIDLIQTGGRPVAFALAGGVLQLDAVQFTDLDEGDSETLTFTFNVTDGTTKVPQTLTLTVEGRNDAPVLAGALSGASDEEAATFTADLLAGATDADRTDTLSVADLVQTGGRAVAYSVVGGQLQLDPAQFNDLAQGESETLTFAFNVTDGTVPVAQTLTVTVEGRNDAPVLAAAVSGASHEDAGIFTADLLAGASDADLSDVLSAADLVQTGGRAVAYSVAGGQLQLDPAQFNDLGQGESETLTFVYVVTDGTASVAQTLTLTVAGGNDAPVLAAALSGASNEEAATFTADLLAGATDADGADTLSVADLVQTGGRAVAYSVAGGQLQLDPAQFNDLALGESETLTFSFNVTDGTTPVAQTLTVTVAGRNDAPVLAAALTGTSNEEAAPFTADLLAGATDADGSDTLSVADLVQTGGRTVAFSAARGQLQLDPAQFNDLAQGESETLTFAFNVTDGTVPVAQTLTVTVEGRNDAPVLAAAVSGASHEDAGIFTADLLAGASDADLSDVLSVADLAQTGGRAVVYSVVGGQLQLDPAQFKDLAVGESETLTFAFNVTDGTTPVAQTLTVTVEGRNDAPVLAAALTGATHEDAAPFTADLLAGATDADLSDVLSVADLVQTGGRAVAYSVAGGQLQLDPAQFNDLALGESETLTFSFNVTDGTTPVAQTLTVTVAGRNDAPVLAAALTGTSNEEAAPFTADLLAGATDADRTDTLSVADLSQTGGRAVAFSVVGGQLQLNPAQFSDLAVGESETLTFAFTVIDGPTPVAQTLTVTVEGRNDAPVLAAVLTGSSNEDAAPFTADLLAGATDADVSDILSVADLVQTGGRAVAFSVVGGQLQLDPAQFNDLALGESETLTFTYAVTDGIAPVTQALTLTIEGRNDGPVATDAFINVGEDGSETRFTLAASDPDRGAALTISLLTQPEEGTVVANSDGTFSFLTRGAFEDLAAGEQRVVSFQWKATDEHGTDSATHTATITVSGANDGPVAIVDVAATQESTALTIASADLLANDSDVDHGDRLTLVGVDGAVGGAVAFNAAGDVVFTPTTGFAGTASFQYVVADQWGAISRTTVIVDVAAVDNMLTGDSAASSYFGGAGVDTVSYAASTAGVTVNLATGSGSGGWAQGDTYAQVENVVGSAYNDVLVGDSADNLLDGGAGGDVLVGGAGSDTVTYARSSGGVVVDLGKGSANKADAKKDSLSGIDNIVGTNYADDLTGDAGANTLAGGFGNDVLAGGAGADTYLFNRGDGTDQVNNGGRAADGDRVLFGSGIAADQLWFSKNKFDLEVSVIGTTDKISVANWFKSAGNHVSSLQTADGHMLGDAQVQNLVSAMAGMTPPAMGQTNLTLAQHQQLDAVLAANWKSS